MAQRLTGEPTKRPVTTDGPNNLGLRELCQRYCDECWVAAHLTPEQAAELVLNEFKRAVRHELEILEVQCVESDGLRYALPSVGRYADCHRVARSPASLAQLYSGIARHTSRSTTATCIGG